MEQSGVAGLCTFVADFLYECSQLQYNTLTCNFFISQLPKLFPCHVGASIERTGTVDVIFGLSAAQSAVSVCHADFISLRIPAVGSDYVIQLVLNPLVSSINPSLLQYFEHLLLRFIMRSSPPSPFFPSFARADTRRYVPTYTELSWREGTVQYIFDQPCLRHSASAPRDHNG